jgi:hypothetical protein
LTATELFVLYRAGLLFRTNFLEHSIVLSN